MKCPNLKTKKANRTVKRGPPFMALPSHFLVVIFPSPSTLNLPLFWHLPETFSSNFMSRTNNTKGLHEPFLSPGGGSYPSMSQSFVPIFLGWKFRATLFTPPPTTHMLLEDNRNSVATHPK